VGEWEVFQMGHTSRHCGSTFVLLAPLDDNKTTMYLFRFFRTFAPVISLPDCNKPKRKEKKAGGEKILRTLCD
jgi:hypothetical protein